MNIRKLVRCATLAVTGGAMALSASAARDLVWLGNVSAVSGYNCWDLTNANWFVMGDATKTRVCFEDGDNAYFLEGEWIEPSTCMMTDTTKWQHEFDIGAIVISNDTTTFSWGCTRAYVNDTTFPAKSIDLYGKGRVSIEKGFEWTCDFNVHGGEVYASRFTNVPYDYRNETGSMHHTRNIRFTDAQYTTVQLGFGGIGNGGGLTLVFTNSTFKVNQTGRYCNIPKGTFYDSTFVFGSDTLDNNAVVFSGTKYVFDGTQPTTIPAYRKVVFGKTRWSPATIEVADVTGDSAPDLILNAVLGKIDVTYNSTKYDYGNFFVKKGPGTMLLNSRGCGDKTCGSMTGDVQVVEGTLAVTNECMAYFSTDLSAFGVINGTEHTVTAKEKGTLEFWNQSFCGLNNPRNFRIAVEEGGTLICHTSQYFGQLLLHGGEFSYTNGSQTTWIEYGLFSFGKKLSFANRVYDLNMRGNHQVMYLGFDDTAVKDTKPIDATHPHLTNFWSVVEMAVADATGDAGVDASIGLDMRDMVNQCYPSYGTTPNSYTYDPWKWCRFRGGIRKTGPGTLRIYGPASYTHTTEVAEGTLRIDSAITKSSGVTVKGGAYLGGTGTVCGVTLEDNGGLELDAARDGGLKIPSLAAEGEVRVHVVNAATSEAADGKVVCELTGKPATLDLSRWRVRFGDTVRAKGLVLAYDPATGRVTVQKMGLAILLK